MPVETTKLVDRTSSTSNAPDPEDYYYVALRKATNRQWFPVGVHASRESAKNSAWQRTKQRIQKARFKPLSVERRFRIVETEWMPYVPDEGDSTAAFEAMEAPSSLIAPPPSMHAAEEGWHEEHELYSYAEGLMEVARQNRKTIDEYGIEEIHNSWAVLIELGEPMKSPQTYTRVQHCRSGIGVESREYLYPVRIVRPTASELAKFSL